MRVLPIPGYEGRYYASTEGDIFSVISGKKKKLNPIFTEKGYLKITLTDSFGVSKTFRVHRIILTTFKYVEGYKHLTVDHINNVKYDNRLLNLRWATTKENIARKKVHGTNLVGEKNHKAKLTEKQIFDIKVLAKTASYSMLSELYKVSRGTIYRIVNNLSWTHLERRGDMKKKTAKKTKKTTKK
jgi:hypothetical protein